METLVPFPADGRDGDCRVELERMLPQGEAVLVRGSGFAPGAKLEVRSQSGPEKHNVEATARADGSYAVVMEPTVKGTKSGTLKVTIVAAVCKPSAKIEWGAGSYRRQ